MVRVYLPEPEEGFELCHPTDPTVFEFLVTRLDGTPRRTGWTPVAMEIIHRDEGKRRKRADAPWLGSHALILRQDAAAAISGSLLPWGEFLPLRCEEAPLAVYNPTNVLDALDEQASDVHRFENGRIMMVKRYAFRKSAIGSVAVFKIPSLRSSPTFFTEPVVRDWMATGIRGVRFEAVWEA
jgi:hypothetical protein